MFTAFFGLDIHTPCFAREKSFNTYSYVNYETQYNVVGKATELQVHDRAQCTYIVTY